MYYYYYYYMQIKFTAHIVAGLRCDSDGGSSIKELIMSSWAASLVQAARPQVAPLLPSLAATGLGAGIWPLRDLHPLLCGAHCPAPPGQHAWHWSCWGHVGVRGLGVFCPPVSGSTHRTPGHSHSSSLKQLSSMRFLLDLKCHNFMIVDLREQECLQSLTSVEAKILVSPELMPHETVSYFSF